MWKDILLLYLVGEIARAQIEDVKSECYSPEVRNGSLANITCIFNYDIDIIKKKIYVDHIPPDRSATASPETVLHCQRSGGNFTCNPKSGYKWTGYVSNRLTFEIPVTLQTHGGQYWCDLLPSQPLNIKRCELHVTGLNFYPVKAVTTTCVSHQVEYGSMAFVNCCFSVDIRDLKKTIFVDHLPVNGSGTPETVLKCRWINENILCNSSAGYQLNGNVTKELVIQITEAHNEHAGLYWCDVLPSNPEDIKQCSLSVTDVQSSSPTTVNENTGRTDSVTESVPKPAASITAIAVPIPVVLVILILSVIIFAYWKRSGRRYSQQSKSESEQPADNSAQNGSDTIKIQNGVPNGQTTESDDESLRFIPIDPQTLSVDRPDESVSLCARSNVYMDTREAETVV